MITESALFRLVSFPKMMSLEDPLKGVNFDVIEI